MAKQCKACGGWKDLKWYESAPKCACGGGDVAGSVMSSARQAFEILALVDWVTPLIKGAVDVKEVASRGIHETWTFFIPYNQACKAGWSEAHIKKLLKKNGIETWAHLVQPGRYTFGCNKKDAGRIEQLFNDNRIPVDTISRSG